MDPGGSLSGFLAGGGGVDTLDYGTRTTASPVLVNLRTGTATSITGAVSGFEVVNGGAGDDGIIAGAGPVTINGGAGNDYIEGSAYDDVLSGGDGSDTILAGDGNDLVDGGAGDDLLVGGNGNDTLRGGGGRDVLIGGAGGDDLQGGSGDDLLIGSDLIGVSDDDLDAILAEWTRTDASYAVRIGHLLNGGPGALNGTVVIRPSNIPDGPNSNVSRDNAADRLEGGAGQDWFISLPEDLIADLATNERVNDVKP
ncbi:MAG: calcium-binding protein [Isosphaeraceae bacterium]